MFTIKLYRENRTRIDSAQSFTIIKESDYLKGITLHKPNGDDEVYYVGKIDDTTSYADTFRCYDHAFVENANAKTTQSIYGT